MGFFLSLHSCEAIVEDIGCGRVGILVDGNHITRVYVAPEFQGRGVGSFIMQHLEDEIAREHATAALDASLPAVGLYERRGYRTQRHERFPVENNAVLVYAMMEKDLQSSHGL